MKKQWLCLTLVATGLFLGGAGPCSFGGIFSGSSYGPSRPEGDQVDYDAGCFDAQTYAYNDGYDDGYDANYQSSLAYWDSFYDWQLDPTFYPDPGSDVVMDTPPDDSGDDGSVGDDGSSDNGDGGYSDNSGDDGSDDGGYSDNSGDDNSDDGGYSDNSGDDSSDDSYSDDDSSYSDDSDSGDDYGDPDEKKIRKVQTARSIIVNNTVQYSNGYNACGGNSAYLSGWSSGASSADDQAKTDAYNVVYLATAKPVVANQDKASRHKNIVHLMKKARGKVKADRKKRATRKVVRPVIKKLN